MLDTVWYEDTNETTPNDIKMVGLFQKESDWKIVGEPDDEVSAPTGVTDHYGIPINAPVHPVIVPAFSTLQGLADKMGHVLTKVTGINATITVEYREATEIEPSCYLFVIQFEKDFGLDLSFEKTLSMGDLAELVVYDASLSVGGMFSLSTELGVIFASDDTTELKIVGSLKDTCDHSGFKFAIEITEDGNTDITNVTVAPTTCAGTGESRKNRTNAMESAIVNAFGIGSNDVTVALFGETTIVLKFLPKYSAVKLIVEKNYEKNPFGLKNSENAKKPGFQFGAGLTQVGASLSVSGGASAMANVGGVLEVIADIDASVEGSVGFNIGTQGELIPVNLWLMRLANVRNGTSEFYEEGFAGKS